MKIFEGIVISIGMNKTAIVEVSRRTPHHLYKKLIKRSKKYKADTASFAPQVGSIVKITETRPISKDKYFKITKILGEAMVKKESIEAIDEISEEVKPATTETLNKTETQKKVRVKSKAIRETVKKEKKKL